ncbi:hypothetical protein CBL13_01080 [Pseudomonas putida]|nr:hypothetical protein CBL13_01080 [Pseudomonas putida]
MGDYNVRPALEEIFSFSAPIDGDLMVAKLQFQITLGTDVSRQHGKGFTQPSDDRRLEVCFVYRLACPRIGSRLRL